MCRGCRTALSSAPARGRPPVVWNLGPWDAMATSIYLTEWTPYKVTIRIAMRLGGYYFGSSEASASRRVVFVSRSVVETCNGRSTQKYDRLGAPIVGDNAPGARFRPVARREYCCPSSGDRNEACSLLGLAGNEVVAEPTPIEADHGEIRFFMPPGQGDDVGVLIIVGSQVSDEHSFAYDAPRIDSVAPDHGPTDGCKVWESQADFEKKRAPGGRCYDMRARLSDPACKMSCLEP